MTITSKSKRTSRELATLLLAKAVVENDAKSMRAALDAGADPEAFWIDGTTLLCNLSQLRNKPVTIKDLLNSGSEKRILSKAADSAQWSWEFVEFVACRGHSFRGDALRSITGRRPPSLNLWTAADAMKTLRKLKWESIADASCVDNDAEGCSHWHLDFGIPGSVIARVRFTVDATGWTMGEMFKKAVEDSRVSDMPAETDPLIARQKEWESNNIAATLVEDGYGIDDLLKYLKKGANPYFTSGKPPKLLGDDKYAAPQAKAFMKAFREALGTSDDWRIKAAPLLTRGSIAAMREKCELSAMVLNAKAPKKSLKERKDIL